MEMEFFIWFALLIPIIIGGTSKSHTKNNCHDANDNCKKLNHCDWMNDYNCRKKFIWNGQEFEEIGGSRNE